MAVPAAYKRSLSTLAVSLIFALPAGAQSLKDAIARTLDSSPDMLADVNHRLSLDEAEKVARGGYLPRVDLNLAGGREWSENATTRALAPFGDRTLTRTESSLTMTQPLFDGFAIQSEVERQRSRVNAAAYKVAGTSEQLALQTVEAYLDVLRQRQLVELTRDNVAIHQRTLDQIRIRSNSGIGRKADLDQIDARYGLAKANLGSAEANLRDAEIHFQRVVGIKPVNLEAPAVLPPGTLPATEEDALRQALDANPILSSARSDVDAADAQNRAAKSTMYPRFDVQLGTSFNRNIDGLPGSNNDKFIMLRMRYNLFNGGSDQARIRETGHLSNEARDLMRRTERQVVQSTRLSWNALISAENRMAPLRQHAEASALTRDAYTKQFAIGQRTLLDLLDAENETFTAASNYLSAQYLQSFARYRILADMGRLLSTLDVGARSEALLPSGN